MAVIPAACIAAIAPRIAARVSSVEGCGMWRDDQLLGALLERAGRLAGRRVADDDAVARVRRVAVDAGEPQRGACSPSRCGRRSSA